MKGFRTPLKRAAYAYSWVCFLTTLGLTTVLYNPNVGAGQVSPAEIKNPKLKAVEKMYLAQLVELRHAIGKMKFPFDFSLNRYAGLDPKEQVGADQRGLEFVDFHGRTVLKLTGNYNASYNADLLTPNQRTDRVFEEVIAPILRMLPHYFSTSDQFTSFGFEISYHTRKRTHGYDYEGKENFVAVMDKSDALIFSNAKDASERQSQLNRSEIYLNGKNFALALGQRDPLESETVEQNSVSPTLLASAGAVAPGSQDSKSLDQPVGSSGAYRTLKLSVPEVPAHTDSETSPSPAVSPTDADALQTKYQAQLDTLAKEGTARYHFVDYAPPSFVVFQNKLFLQLTLRNPAGFEKESSSIYKRAARSFDLFLFPQLKPILDKVPNSTEFAGLDVTILNDLVAQPAHSSEALELVASLAVLRRFVNAEITNQELINQSIVLVNGVRIALNLQQVE